MHPFTELVDRYIAVWNEPDNQKRQDLIARTWTSDATYVDPLMRAEGQDAVNALAQGVQAQFPGCFFRRTSDVDAHNNRVRFTWELGPESGASLAKGIDFGVIFGDHLQSITGFLDFIPTVAGE